MKVKSPKDTKMKRLGAEELVELGKYRLSRGSSKKMSKKSAWSLLSRKRRKWCVRKNKKTKCYKTIREFKRAISRGVTEVMVPSYMGLVTKGKK